MMWHVNVVYEEDFVCTNEETQIISCVVDSIVSSSFVMNSSIV